MTIPTQAPERCTAGTTTARIVQVPTRCDLPVCGRRR
jgi:hypothetical protein